MGHVTPALDDHVGVNVIMAIITAYMVKRREVLTQSGPTFCERVMIPRGVMH